MTSNDTLTWVKEKRIKNSRWQKYGGNHNSRAPCAALMYLSRKIEPSSQMDFGGRILAGATGTNLGINAIWNQRCGSVPKVQEPF